MRPWLLLIALLLHVITFGHAGEDFQTHQVPVGDASILNAKTPSASKRLWSKLCSPSKSDGANLQLRDGENPDVVPTKKRKIYPKGEFPVPRENNKNHTKLVRSRRSESKLMNPVYSEHFMLI